MRALACLAAVLLAAGGAVAPALIGAPSAAWGAQPPSIDMTVINDGVPVSLLDAAEVPWAHIGAKGGPTTITVTIHLGDTPVIDYAGRLSAPDAYQGPGSYVCFDGSHVVSGDLVCSFAVPISRGINRLDFVFAGAGLEHSLVVHGFLHGAELEMSSALEARDAAGRWQLIPQGGELALFGAQTSELRYLVANIGDMPFTAPGSCAISRIPPGGVSLCTLRGPRPVYALAGPYSVPVVLADPVGGGASFTIDARITALRPSGAVAPDAAPAPWGLLAIPMIAALLVAIVIGRRGRAGR